MGELMTKIWGLKERAVSLFLPLMLLVFSVVAFKAFAGESNTTDIKQMPMFVYFEKDSADVSSVARAQINSSTQSEITASQLIDKQGLETWKVVFNKQIKELEEGDVLQIPLPNGEILSATIKQRLNLKNGDVQLRAPIGGNGGISITMNDEIMFANINSVDDHVSFSIGLNDAKQQILIDQNTLPADAINFENDIVYASDMLSHAELHEAEIANSLGANEIIAQQTSEEKTNLDILFVYSPEFEALFTSAETRINQLVEFSNLAYDNSGVLINMRVAGAVELAIENDDSVSDLLFDARNGVNGFESVDGLRDQFGADLVAVLTTRNDNGSNGVAFINAQFESLGFSSTKISANCCDLVFTHEIGHNLGSGHERLSVNPNQTDPCTGGAEINQGGTGFSCGHGSIANNWGTLMSSSSQLSRSRAGNIFSNPDLTCFGSPCGVDQNEPESADNRTSFNITRLVISQFRDEVIVEQQDDVEFYVIPLSSGGTVVYPL